jgi:hypothetical protein
LHAPVTRRFSLTSLSEILALSCCYNPAMPMRALIVTALLGLAGATVVLAQDRIKETPGHDQFTNMQPQINGSVTPGSLAVTFRILRNQRLHPRERGTSSGSRAAVRAGVICIRLTFRY